MIELKNINKSFGENIIFKDVNYIFKDRGLYLILGSSGSGKTTLLNLISNMEKTDIGDIYIDLKSVKVINDIFSNTLSYVTQNNNLVSGLTVKENINLISEVDENLLEKVKLKHLLNTKVDNLSNGERQRLVLIMAYLKDNPIILIDEPTAALDKENAHIISNLIKSISKNKLVIVTSHNEDLFKQICDYLLIIKDNKLVEEEINNETNNINNLLDINNKVKNNFNIKYFLNVLKRNIFKFSIFTLLITLFTLLLFIVVNIKFFSLTTTTINYLEDKNYDYLPVVRYIDNDGKEVEINYGSMLYDDYLDSVRYIDININNLPTRIYLNNNKVNYLTDFAYNNLSKNIIDGNVTLDLTIKSNNFQVKFKPDTIIKVDAKLEDYLNKVELSSLDRDNLLGRYNYINLDRELFVNSLYENYNLYIPLVEKKNLDSQIFLTIHYCIYNNEPLIAGEKEEYMASDQVIISKALYDYLFDEPFEKNMVYDFRIPERKTNPIYQEIPDLSYSPFDHGMRIIGIVDSNEYEVYCDYFTLNSIASQYSFYMVSGYVISNNIDNIKKIYELGDYINYNNMMPLKTVNNILASDDVKSIDNTFLIISILASIALIMLFISLMIKSERRNLVTLKVFGFKTKNIIRNYVSIFLFSLLISLILTLIIDIFITNMINSMLMKIASDIGVTYFNINYLANIGFYLIIVITISIITCLYLNYIIKKKTSYIIKNN